MNIELPEGGRIAGMTPDKPVKKGPVRAPGTGNARCG